MNYCARCQVNFTSISAFDKHLGSLLPDGYEHKAPEDCGLVRGQRGISLPPPMRRLNQDEWRGIFSKETHE